MTERWKRLFSLPQLVARYVASEKQTKAEREKAQSLIATWRVRLSDLSWYMRSLNESLARRANAEDNCKGRFWEGRYISQALLDEAAVLTCMSYVDLDPIRANMAKTPEDSEYTSIQQRIREHAHAQSSEQETTNDKPCLTPLKAPQTETHRNAFSFSTEDYLTLVDRAGRAILEEKRGSIPEQMPPILKRLGLEPNQYLRHVQRGGRAYHVAALGYVDRLREAASTLGRCFHKGVGISSRLYIREA